MSAAASLVMATIGRESIVLAAREVLVLVAVVAVLLWVGYEIAIRSR